VNGSRPLLGDYRDRFTRWWSPARSGPLLQIEYPGKDEPPKPAWARTHDTWWWLLQWLQGPGRDDRADLDPFLAGWEAHVMSHGYAGDAVPQVWLNLGPGVLAAYLTGYLRFETSTSWFELPEPMPWDDIMKLDLRPDAPWYARTRRLAAAMARRANGRYAVGMTDLGGVMDVTASLRTGMQLLEDCVTDPDLVDAANRRLLGIWHRCFDELDGVLQAEGADGRAAWMGLWARERWYPFQCDFCAMLSPKMTERFVIPDLREQCRRVEHGVYHWDGPGELAHLDLLLSIPELKAIQWVPGASAPGSGDPRWLPYYRRILSAGKRLILNADVSPADIPVLLKSLPREGLLVSTWARDEAHAADLLKLLPVLPGT
jgi:5-methyltetrahydrofolate--homocysteine methyltransferase